jgi:hypothetical protein
MLVSFAILSTIVHVRPLTALAFILLLAIAICLWTVGLTLITVGCLTLKNAAKRSRNVRTVLRVVIAGFIAFIILAPIIDSMAHAATRDASIASPCAVPLVPGTTPQDAKHGIDMVMRGMSAPLRPAPGSTVQAPLFIINHHTQWRT